MVELGYLECGRPSILTATAKVSKILWPSKGKNYIERENRANRLHQMLNVSSDNSLIDLTMRHRFEHNDERIDDWFKDKKSAVYYDNMIEGYRFEHLDFSTNYHRSYNPFTKTLSFRGESINLAEVLQELEKIILSCGNYVLT